jgi:hypothetical protein
VFSVYWGDLPTLGGSRLHAVCEIQSHRQPRWSTGVDGIGNPRFDAGESARVAFSATWLTQVRHEGGIGLLGAASQVDPLVEVCPPGALAPDPVCSFWFPISSFDTGLCKSRDNLLIRRQERLAEDLRGVMRQQLSYGSNAQPQLRPDSR